MTLSGRTYKCSNGETFDSIALAVYGDEVYASDLLCANPALCRIPVFTGGEVLQLPLVDIIVSENDDAAETYTPAKAPWKE